MLAVADSLVGTLPGPDFIGFATSRANVSLNLLRYFSATIRKRDRSPTQRLAAEFIRLAGAGMDDKGRARIEMLPDHGDLARACSAGKAEVAAFLADLTHRGILRTDGRSALISDITELTRRVREGGYESRENENAVLSLFRSLYFEK